MGATRREDQTETHGWFGCPGAGGKGQRGLEREAKGRGQNDCAWHFPSPHTKNKKKGRPDVDSASWRLLGGRVDGDERGEGGKAKE